MTAEVESLQKLILATMNEDAGVSYGRIPLSLSEEIATLISELKKGGCIFQFRKKDGQIRRAAGTLSQEVIDRYREESDTYVPKRYKKKARPTSTAYFDLEKGEFRCFLWENFLGMESDYCI